MDNQQFWIVGNHLGQPNAWEFGGLYEDEVKALAACDSLTDFIAPVYLNQIPGPGKGIAWPGSYYPNDHQTP